MNTGKQINAMVFVLFLVLIVVGAYTIWDPFRSADAADAQLAKTADFGAQTFERNCRLCHGDRGEGPPTSGRLASAIPLNTDTLQGIDNGVFDQAKKNDAYKRITNTIMCGRVGTQMPTWGVNNGGTLSDEQIRQLAVLITEGRWDLVEEHSDNTDAMTTNHAKVDADGGTFAADATDLNVSNAGAFSLGQYVRIGEERLRVLPKEVLIERGVDGTEAVDHDRGTQILVDGQPVRRNQTPTLRDGQIVLLGGAQESLAEPITKDGTALPVGDNRGFDAGDILQLDDEHVRVTGITTGIPSTGVVVAKEFRREPKKIFVSGAGDITEGDLIRIDSEPMTIKSVGEAGTGVKLDEDTTSASNVVSVEDARFLRKGYQFNVGDEWMQVIGAVDTGQTVDAVIGRAQSTLSVSGTLGIEQGMLIRIDGELLKVTQIIRPARAQIKRGQDGTTVAEHAAGTSILKLAAKDAEDQTPADSGQATLDAVSADGYLMSLTGIAKVNVGDKYKLDDETIEVAAVDPAIVRIQRGVRHTDVAEHTRRSSIFVGNYLNVTRGINGTGAADHSAGDEIILTQFGVKRAVGVKPAEHAKNAELFQGNHLTVARGVKATEPSEHKSGDLVRNFPPAPDGPPTTGLGISICGQKEASAPSTPGDGGPTATPPVGATSVSVSLDEFKITVDPASASGAIVFQVTDDGTTAHNFRLVKTDLASDQLPVASNKVDESKVDVLAESNGDLNSGATQTVSPSAALEAGNYVLICNVTGHYKLGMYAAFTVQ
jgi:mono/diheme cytochrome c family protein